MRKRSRTAGAPPRSAPAATHADTPAPPLPTSPINPDVLLPERVRELKARFDAGKPFKHAVVRDVMTREAARRVHEEVGRLHGDLKETDLFRVYQTGDLANADEADPQHAAELGALLALRRAINSPEFRGMIEQVSGCGPLSRAVDLSANVYARGGHLLCHDDVIGTRRVSYIVYVGDPDDEWGPEDGGRLELYEADPRTRLPLAEPCARVPPTFNTLAFFVVEAGVSFHSVEEVFADGKPRVSLQGWFHAEPQPDAAAAAAAAAPTVKTLLNSGSACVPPLSEPVDVSGHYAGAPGEENAPLTPADVAELGEWVNPLFLTPENMDRMREQCEKEQGCVSLLRFLREDVAESLRASMFAEGAAAPAPRLWDLVGPAHVQRFVRLGSGRGAAAPALERELRRLLEERVASPAFTRFIRRVTALDLTRRRACVRRFRKGSDYTVAYAHDEPNALDVTLCFVDDSSQAKADDWASGDVGGYELYLDREEDGVGDVAAAAVYARNEEQPGVVSIDAAFGTLAIVDRDARRMRFVKYVGRAAPSDRFDVACTFEFREAEEEAQGGGGA